VFFFFSFAETPSVDGGMRREEEKEEIWEVGALD
jgi:hypothetical protein